MREVRFPDGTSVRACALADRDVNDGWREHGLYLDARWAPTWPAQLVDWPDLGVPSDARAATDAIVGAFERARAGVHVEVGCYGGRGRTGTVLACMALLAGVPVDDCVEWLRRHHLADAVETSAQEAWVHDFALRIGAGTNGPSAGQ